MRVIAAIRQRWIDWRRERLITELRVEACALLHTGEPEAARQVAALMFAECARRSPQQIKRMEAPIFGADQP